MQTEQLKNYSSKGFAKIKGEEAARDFFAMGKFYLNGGYDEGVKSIVQSAKINLFRKPFLNEF